MAGAARMLLLVLLSLSGFLQRCTAQPVPAPTPEGACIKFNVTANECTGCRDGYQLNTSTGICMNNAPDDSQQSDGQEMLVIGILVLAFILMAFLAIYCFFCHESDPKEEAGGDKEGFVEKDGTRSPMSSGRDVNVNETMRKGTSPSPSRSPVMMPSRRAPPIAYTPPEPRTAGRCEIEFRAGDIWRRGEIVNVLPDGNVEIQAGSLFLTLRNEDITMLGVPVASSEAAGYSSGSMITSKRCSHRETAPPSLHVMPSKRRF